jgi:general nucleoside transport system permease protein
MTGRIEPVREPAGNRSPALLATFAIPLAAVALALLLCAVIIALVGTNPLDAYRALARGAFGSTRAATQTAIRAAPLLLIALGLTLAFRSKVWNIGAEGQFFMGALAASWFALQFDSLPPAIMLPAMVAVAFLGGALWGLIPALLRAYMGANEIVTSLLLNYVAAFFVAYLVRSPMKDPNYFLPQSAPLPAAATIPLLGNSKLHAGIILALVCVPIIYLILWKTPLGYRLRVVGSNPDAARYAGISVERSIITVMLISGGMAGIAGMVEVAAVHHRLMTGISAGFGFTAIVVALLGQLNPLGVLVAAYFFASLVIGADSMQRVVGLPVSLTEIIQALVVLFFLAGDHFSKRRK